MEAVGFSDLRVTEDQKPLNIEEKVGVVPAQNAPPALELIPEPKVTVSSTINMPLAFDSVVEEEVESGTVLSALPPSVQHQAAPEMTRASGIVSDLNRQCLPCPQRVVTEHNESSDGAESDPLSYKLSSTGQLMEDPAEWARRPLVTVDGNGEMVFRPLSMKCTHCEECYTKTSDLYAHIRTHQRHTECPHCGKVLTCMATFVYHVRTHTMEKPYYCPCDGCDFQNAVKYNLKVHLACIRHGGKANLAKYAKVLDLDVCDKSLRKRKDNSVHELGSRRSKKRRKLNNGSSRRADRHRDHGLNAINAMNPMAGLGGMQSAAYGGYYNQEEYDQMSAQLLFQLGQYPQIGMNSMNAMNPMPNMTGNMYEPMQMDWAANVGMMEQMPQMPPMPQIPQMGLQMDASGNVKDEQKLLQSQMNPMGQMLQMDPQQMNPLMIGLKSEQLPMGQMNLQMTQQMGQQLGQQMSFDPNFGYFYQNQMNPLPNPTLVGNETVNVDLSDYPTPQELEPEALSKDCKVDSAVISNTKPAGDQAQDGGEREIEEKGESNGQEIVQKPADSTNPASDQQGPTADPVALNSINAMMPKPEPQGHGEQMNYDLMLQQQQQLMVDPNAMMMQQQQYEQQMAAQYMMMYQDPNAMMMQYGQQGQLPMMYDPNMVSPANGQPMGQMPMMFQEEDLKKDEAQPPLPASIQ